jgi:hypothetical protein
MKKANHWMLSDHLNSLPILNFPRARESQPFDNFQNTNHYTVPLTPADNPIRTPTSEKQTRNSDEPEFNISVDQPPFVIIIKLYSLVGVY